MENVSIVAILVAALAHFFFGFIWFTPLFGKAWAKEMGFDYESKPPASAMVKGLILNVIGCFLMAWVLATDLQAWTFVPGMEKASDMHFGLMGAFFIWLGFYVPSDLNVVAWEQKSWKLFFINTFYHLIGLVIAGQIIVALR